MSAFADGSSVSDGSDGSLALVTDGIASGTGASVGVDATGGARDGEAWALVNLPVAGTVIHVTVRLSTVPSSGVSVLALPTDGTTPVAIGTVAPSQAGTSVELATAATAADGVEVSGVLLQASQPFAVAEVAAMTAPCSEWLVVDFGAPREVRAWRRALGGAGERSV